MVSSIKVQFFFEITKHDTEGFLVYIKDNDFASPDDLLATAYVDENGQFSANWYAAPIDGQEDRNVEIYAVFEGNNTLGRLTTCDLGYTSPLGGFCINTIDLVISDSGALPPSDISDAQYMELFYSLNLDTSPHVAIVPSPDSYDIVRSYISATQEGVLMWTSLLESRQAGDWDATFEVVGPGSTSFSSKPDIVMNLETPDSDSGCFRDYAGWARIYQTSMLPVQTVVCIREGIPSQYVMDTAAHEFIHAMGLGHTFNKGGDLMCSVENGIPTCPASSSESRPSQLNLDAVEAIYKQDGYMNPNNIIEYKDRFPSNPQIDSEIPAVIIEPTPGSGVPGCENEVDGCYIPSIAIVDVGGIVIFSNTDNVAHTFTSGSMEEGPSGIFDSGLAIAGSSYEYNADIVGRIPYFCIVHPWSTGLIVVKESTTFQSQTEYVKLDVSAFNDDNGNAVRDATETPHAGLLILTYTPSTRIVDLLITDMNGTAFKTDLTPNSFYAITLPPEGQVASTNQFTLGGTTYNGVLYVENPSNRSTHTMNIGIKADPCTLIPEGNIANVLLGCPTA